MKNINKKVLHSKDYCWESSADIPEDVDWSITQLADQYDGGEFPGTIRVTVEYLYEED